MKKSGPVQELTPEDIEQANMISKSLIGVGEHGRPFVDYLLYNVRLAGYKKVYLVVSPNDHQFREFYGVQEKAAHLQGFSISFALQHVPKDREKPCGTADAVYQTLEQYPELHQASFTVCNSDNLYSVEALTMLRSTTSPNALISYDRDALQFPPERISRFAVVQVDEENFLEDIIEKPEPEELGKYKDNSGNIRVSMNAFKFDGAMFSPFLENCPFDPIRNEKELPTALLNMVKVHPKTVLAIPFSEHVPDLTSKEDISSVRAYLNKHLEKFSWGD